MDGALKILRIEVDGHFHGSPIVPKPWVAQIDGVDAKYGLARTFVQPLRDYRSARRAWSGNLHGVVAAFPLHEGRLYEVSRLRGSKSKRYVAREFLLVEEGKFRAVEPIDALAVADPYAGSAVEHVVADSTSVGRIDGLGAPLVCGFVLLDGRRHYRLRVNSIHEVNTGSERHLIIAGTGPGGADRISYPEALARLASSL